MRAWRSSGTLGSRWSLRWSSWLQLIPEEHLSWVDLVLTGTLEAEVRVGSGLRTRGGREEML